MNDIKINTIFISYCWSDFEIANVIEAKLNIPGINIIRDIKMQYMDNIFDFMKSIRDEGFALLLISDDYLKSDNCMREMLEIIEEDFSKKILPIILPNTKIFKPQDRISILKHWEKKIESLNAELRELNSLANAQEIISLLDIYQKIRDSIDKFIAKIIQLNCKNYQELLNKDFKQLLDHIGIKDVDYMLEIIRISNIKNLQEREIAIEKEYDTNPEKGYLKFLKANLSLDEQKYDKAEMLFRELLVRNKKHPDLYNNLGVCLNKQGLYDDAILQYQNAIKCDNLYSRAYSNLGLILHERFKKYKESEENYLKSLEIEYTDFWTHYNLANLYCDIGNYLKAEFHYNEAIKLIPIKSESEIETASIYFNFANFFHTKNLKYDDAKVNYLKCIDLNPNHYQARCNFAVLLKNIFGDYEEAKNQYDEVLRINPKDSITLNNLGNLYYKHLHNITLAEHHFLKSIEFDINCVYPYYGLGLIYFKEDVKKAKEYFETAIKKDSKFALAHFELAKIYMTNLNNKELAQKHYVEAFKNNFNLYSPENNQFFNLNILNIGF